MSWARKRWCGWQRSRRRRVRRVLRAAAVAIAAETRRLIAREDEVEGTAGGVEARGSALSRRRRRWRHDAAAGAVAPERREGRAGGHAQHAGRRAARGAAARRRAAVGRRDSGGAHRQHKGLAAIERRRLNEHSQVAFTQKHNHGPKTSLSHKRTTPDPRRTSTDSREGGETATTVRSQRWVPGRRMR